MEENNDQSLSLNQRKTIVQDKYPLSDLTGKIIGCAMEVHRIMGNGFQEVIYQRCLAFEMSINGLSFSREHEMDLYYKACSIASCLNSFWVIPLNDVIWSYIDHQTCIAPPFIKQG